MKVMTEQEIKEHFDMSSAELEQLEKDATKGIFHGEKRGEVVVGRPQMFGEETRQVGFREPVSKIDAIESRAASLGMKRSDYLRYLVDRDLATVS